MTQAALPYPIPSQVRTSLQARLGDRFLPLGAVSSGLLSGAGCPLSGTAPGMVASRPSSLVRRAGIRGGDAAERPPTSPTEDTPPPSRLSHRFAVTTGGLGAVSDTRSRPMPISIAAQTSPALRQRTLQGVRRLALPRGASGDWGDRTGSAGPPKKVVGTGGIEPPTPTVSR
jgi:hypothetical protein